MVEGLTTKGFDQKHATAGPCQCHNTHLWEVVEGGLYLGASSRVAQQASDLLHLCWLVTAVTVPVSAATHTTVAPVMFGKPLLNNVLAFDHALLQK